MTDLRIENIVATIDFHRELDLSAVGDLLESVGSVSYVDYTPEENHWLQTRFTVDGESRYVAFYRSGTCAIVGCNSFDQIESYADKIIASMAPVTEKEPTLEIRNLVCVGELSQDIDLAYLAIAAGLENTEYEPEQFPGLIYRDEHLGAVLLVFASGKVIVTGLTSIETAKESFCHLTRNLKEWNVIT